jgi:hypothetical protein
MSGQLHIPAALSPVSIEYEARWTPEPVWTLWRRGKSRSCRESNPGRPDRSPSLHRMSYHDSISIYHLLAKLLLVHASTVILGSEAPSIHDHILLSDGSGSHQNPLAAFKYLLPDHGRLYIISFVLG